MRKIMFAFMGFLILGWPLALFPNPGLDQDDQDVSITIVPDREIYIPFDIGVEIPTFTIKTKPQALVAVRLSSESGFITADINDVSDAAHADLRVEQKFNSYFGNLREQVEPALLEADENGVISYPIPEFVFAMMSNYSARIYYGAEVIEPQGDSYVTLGKSFSSQVPQIRIDESAGVSRAKEYFYQGKALYEDGKYFEAIEAFRKALPYFDSYKIRYNIGAASVRMAIEYLSEAAEGFSESNPDEARAIREIIASLKNFFAEEKRSP